MAERRENSVLFSLKELRRIEDDRLKKEDDDRQAQEDAERQAKEAAERSAREAAEATQRAEEERLQALADAKAAQEREERLRVEAAERKARVDADSKLREEQMRLDAQVRAARKSPVVKYVVVGFLVVIGVGAYFGKEAWDQAQAEKIAIQQEKQKLIELQKQIEADFAAEKLRIKKAMDAKLAAATSPEERDRIVREAKQEEARAEAQRERDKRDRKRSRRSSSSSSASSGAESDSNLPTRVKKIHKKALSDDPLDGLSL